MKRLRAFPGWKRWLAPRAVGVTALMCLALVVLLTTIQVAHVHPLNSDADHCPLCIVMHTAAPVEAITAVIVLVSFGTATPLAEAHAVVRHRHPKLLIRPPPACC